MLAHRLNVSQPKTFSEHITQHLISNEKIKTPPIQKDATFMIMSLSIQESGTTPNHRARLINSQDRFANKWQVINQTILQTFQRCFSGVQAQLSILFLYLIEISIQPECVMS